MSASTTRTTSPIGPPSAAPPPPPLKLTIGRVLYAGGPILALWN